MLRGSQWEAACASGGGGAGVGGASAVVAPEMVGGSADVVAPGLPLAELEIVPQEAWLPQAQ